MAADFHILCYISFFLPAFVIFFDFLSILCILTIWILVLVILISNLPILNLLSSSSLFRSAKESTPEIHN